jgi:hypothetical protein
MESGALMGWAVALVLTLLMIVPPLLYLLVLDIRSDGPAFDRTVREVERYGDAIRSARARRQLGLPAIAQTATTYAASRTTARASVNLRRAEPPPLRRR